MPFAKWTARIVLTTKALRLRFAFRLQPLQDENRHSITFKNHLDRNVMSPGPLPAYVSCLAKVEGAIEGVKDALKDAKNAIENALK